MGKDDSNTYDLVELFDTEEGRRYIDLIEREWDFEKNNSNNLFPDKISVTNNKQKVYWKCQYGHKWMATVYDRIKKRGATNCPLCNRSSFGEFAILYYLRKYFNELDKKFDELDEEEYVSLKVHSRRLLNDVIGDCKRDYGRLEADIDIVTDKLKIIIEHNSHRYHSKANRVESDLKKKTYIDDSEYQFIRFYAYKSNIKEASAEYYYKEGNYTQLELMIKKFFVEQIDKDYEKTFKETYGKTFEIDIKKDSTAILESYYPKKLVSSRIEELKKTDDYRFDTKKAIRRIQLACEWDFEKNCGLSIFNFAPTSGFYVNWRCRNCGHEWISTIGNRLAGRDCPECVQQKKRATKIKNTKYKDSFYARCFDKTVLYWDFERNRISPEQIKYTSTEEIQCRCGKHNHIWTSTPLRLSKSKCGCSMCGSDSSAKKKNKYIYQLDWRTFEVIRKYDSYTEVKKAGFGEVIKDREGKARYLNSGIPYRNFIWIDDFTYLENAKKQGHASDKEDSSQTMKLTLKEQFPEFIERYWDWEANEKEGIFPDEVTCGQATKVFLKCKIHNISCNPHAYTINSAFKKSDKGFRVCEKCAREQGVKIGNQKGRVAVIDAYTKEIKIFQSRTNARNEMPNFYSYTQREAGEPKSVVRYFRVDIDDEIKQNSLLSKYLESYIDNIDGNS